MAWEHLTQICVVPTAEGWLGIVLFPVTALLHAAQRGGWGEG